MTSLEFVRALVESGADVNQVIQRGKSPGKARLNRKLATPFLFASATCDLPLMELLLELGADATLTNADDCNALMAAAGIGVTAVGEEPGTEPEVCAAIKRLAGLGLDVNHVDKNGETAMHGAAYRTFPKAVETLAALGADPEIWNQKNTHGWTPYSIAGGKRPGSVKPSPETKRALDAAKQNATLR
jgi:ankyrin repeat protein